MQRRLNTTRYLWVGLIASIFPDLDLLYFYFIDQRRTLHHEYWMHLPLFWLSVWIAALIVFVTVKNKNIFLVSTIFIANIFLHLILDTFAAGIPWLYPFSHTSFVLIQVPSRYPFWIENFVFHWSFLVELAIVLWAVIVWLKDRKKTIALKTLEDRA